MHLIRPQWKQEDVGQDDDGGVGAEGDSDSGDVWRKTDMFKKRQIEGNGANAA